MASLEKIGIDNEPVQLSGIKRNINNIRALLLNPVNPPSFWSFRESCKIMGVKALGPPLGLMTIAALLPREWQLRLKDLNTQAITDQDWDWADIILISGMFVQREGILALIAAAKKHNKTVVVGGPYVTSVPDEASAAGADFLVLGEGEITIPLFLAALQRGKATGVFRQKKRPSLDLSPIPRFDLLDLQDYVSLSVQTSRGCPHDCEFCDIINLFGRKPRYKSPLRVIEELEALLHCGGRRRDVFIADDNFIGSRKHAVAILQELIPWMESHRKPFTFLTQTTAALGQDFELMALMRQANFRYVFVGIETPDEEILTLNRKYHNVRHPLSESVINMKNHGLIPIASFVLGFDQEKSGAGERICQFVEDHDIPVVMLNTLQILPNTALWQRLKDENRLIEARTSGDNTGAKLNYVPTRPEPEIMAEYLRAFYRLYEPSSYLNRVYNYFRAMGTAEQNLKPIRQDLAPRPTGKKKKPMQLQKKELASLLQLLWRQGIRPAHRMQFWRQLKVIYEKYPELLVTYLNACGLGENFFELREDLRRKMTDSRHSGNQPGDG